MRKTVIALVALGLVVASSAFAANAVRISQVYGGGGATTGTPSYQQDYVEIFNSGAATADVSNWAIVYGSSTGTWNNAGGTSYTSNFVFPAGTTIKPCGYLLVAFKWSGGTYTGADLTATVTPDFYVTGAGGIMPITLSGTNGKVMLTQSVPANAVACGSEGVVIVDKVSFGTAATCAETTPTASLSTTTADVRKLGGMTDTDSNVADFTVTTNPVPHSGVSGYRNPDCLTVPATTDTWGRVKTLYR
jgi:uncharacterized protein